MTIRELFKTIESYVKYDFDIWEWFLSLTIPQVFWGSIVASLVIWFLYRLCSEIENAPFY